MTVVHSVNGTTFMFGNDPGFSVTDSYRIASKKDIMHKLELLHASSEYWLIRQYGYNRTLKSEYREWRAHNILYKLGIARKRTGTVDITQHESKLRRFAYAILSIF